MRVESETLLHKFKGSTLIRINPVRGLKSIYGEERVRFIDESNVHGLEDDGHTKPNIICIEKTAKEGINLIY